MSGRLFVYGSLRPGGSANRRVLGRYQQKTEPATLSDHALYGRTFKYPFVAREPGRVVVGDLVSFPVAVEEELLVALDEYEGDEYVRTTAVVTTAEGEPIEAWVYLAFPDVAFDPAERIDSGDWFG